MRDAARDKGEGDGGGEAGAAPEQEAPWSVGDAKGPDWRCRVPCAVCAGGFWNSEVKWCKFFGKGGRDSIFGARDKQRAAAWKLFRPEAYHDLWSYALPAGRGAPGARGGVTLEELEASAVRDPTDPDRLWLLHRRVFEMERHPETCQLVARLEQRVAVCGDCHCCLSTPGRVSLPRFSLPASFWVGKEVVVDVAREGARERKLKGFGDLDPLQWMLLQLTRPVMKQVYLRCEKGVPAYKRKLAQVGLSSNTIVVHQAPVDHALYTDEATVEAAGTQFCIAPPCAEY